MSCWNFQHAGQFLRGAHAAATSLRVIPGRRPLVFVRDILKRVLRDHHPISLDSIIRLKACLVPSDLGAALGLLLLSVLTGCRLASPAPYVSPRVTGRVLDHLTQQPLKGVKVQRLMPDQQPNVLDDVKGGQALAGTPAVRTAADGTFELPSERTLSPLQRGGWYSVSIVFEHSDYLRYVTNYSLKHSVLTPKGEPVVKAGEIPLQKKSP